MAINPTDPKVQALFTAANAAFQKGKPTTPSDYEKIATTIVSNTKSNTYPWLRQFPSLREFIGARVLNDMKEHGYQLFNKKYEASVSVDLADIEDDTIGVYAPMVTELGLAASTYPNQYVFDILTNGFTNICYDGKAFFAADHQVAGSAVANMAATGSGTPWFVFDTSSALKPLIFQIRQKPKLVQFQYRMEEYDELVYGYKTRFSVGYGFWQRAYASKDDLTGDNLQAAITAMRNFKDDEGKPLNIKPTLLIVPPSLEWKARELLKATQIIGSSNTLYNALDLLVTNWLV